MDDFDLADLRLFAAVHRAGGINRAAKELNTVQSNVTKKLQALERKIGVDLVARHRGGITLTDAGRRLMPYVGMIEHLLREAHAAAVDPGRPEGILRIGSMETTAALRLPPVLIKYATDYPDVDVIVRTGTSSGLREMVLARELDGALVAGGTQHPDLEAVPVLREKMVVLMPRSYGSLADLGSRAEVKVIIFRTGCSYRERLEAFLWSHGVTRLRYLEFGTLDGILGCVSAGMGVTLLPHAVIGHLQTSNVTVHEPAGDLALVDTSFVRRKDGLLSSALTAFLQGLTRKTGMPQKKHEKSAPCEPIVIDPDRCKLSAERTLKPVVALS